MTVLGHDSTVPASMDEMLVLTRAVTRGARRPLVIADMPFGSFQVSDAEAVDQRDPVRQGGRAPTPSSSRAPGPSLSRVAAIVGAGIPVMGHIGLTPQSATALGGFKAQGRTADQARRLIDDARALEAAGCFSIVLEAVPAPVAEEITRRLTVPTIGIGAGGGTDGQVLVWHDLLGLYDGPSPRFVKRYADLATVDPRGRLRLRRRRPRAPLPRGGAHVRHVRRGARCVPRRSRGAGGRAADPLEGAREHGERRTITLARSSAPRTPRHGSRNVVRSPSATSASDHAMNASPIPTTTSRAPRVSPPVVRNQSHRTAMAITGTTTTSESASGTAANATTWRAILNGCSTPTAFAPSQSARPSRKYPAAP